MIVRFLLKLFNCLRDIPKYSAAADDFSRREAIQALPVWLRYIEPHSAVTSYYYLFTPLVGVLCRAERDHLNHIRFGAFYYSYYNNIQARLKGRQENS